jgi:hypothetical protein
LRLPKIHPPSPESVAYPGLDMMQTYLHDS